MSVLILSFSSEVPGFIFYSIADYHFGVGSLIKWASASLMTYFEDPTLCSDFWKISIYLRLQKEKEASLTLSTMMYYNIPSNQNLALLGENWKKDVPARHFVFKTA